MCCVALATERQAPADLGSQSQRFVALCMARCQGSPELTIPRSETLLNLFSCSRVYANALHGRWSPAYCKAPPLTGLPAAAYTGRLSERKLCRTVHEALDQLQVRARAAVSSMADLQLDAAEEDVQKALQALNGSFCPPLQRLSMQHCHR